MAHGLPVLVAEGMAPRGYGQARKRLVDSPGDQDALQMPSRALSDPVRLRRMGYQSYRIALYEVNIQSMARVFLRHRSGSPEPKGKTR
jgi:hypothetical protein